MKYRISTLVAAIAFAVLAPSELATRISRMDDGQQAEGGRLLTAQNEARKLLAGTDNFADVWHDQADTSPHDPQQIDIWVDQVVNAVKGVTDMAPFPADTLHHWVLRIAQADPAHPLAAHWQVLHAACHAMDQPAPDWSDIAALVPPHSPAGDASSAASSETAPAAGEGEAAPAAQS